MQTTFARRMEQHEAQMAAQRRAFEEESRARTQRQEAEWERAYQLRQKLEEQIAILNQHLGEVTLGQGSEPLTAQGRTERRVNFQYFGATARDRSEAVDR